MFNEIAANSPTELVQILDDLYDELQLGALSADEAAAYAILARFRFEAVEKALYERQNPRFRIADAHEVA